MPIRNVFAVLTAMLVCSPATAITFNFQNVVTTTFTEQGLTLNASAFLSTGATTSVPAAPNSNGAGAGIGGGGTPGGGQISAQEFFLFEFDGLVRLDSITIVETGGSDESVSILYPGFATQTETVPGDGPAETVFDGGDFNGLLANPTTSFIVFGPPADPTERGIRIAEIEVSRIPLPAAGLLLLGGLGALVAAGRRRA
ncbi:MAG: VPLPA-CTERM sorting domain-containing protein [Paracoccaceae bacterium]